VGFFVGCEKNLILSARVLFSRDFALLAVVWVCAGAVCCC